MNSTIKKPRGNKQNKRKITTSEFLAQCALRRSLRQHYAFWQGVPIILGLVIPKPADIEIYQGALSSLAAGNFDLFDDFYREDTAVVKFINKMPKAAKAYHDSQFEETLASHSRVLVVVFDTLCFPSGFEHYADDVIDVAGPNDRHIVAAGKWCVGMDVSPELARLIANMPLDVIGKTLRRGRSAEKALKQMRAMNANNDVTKTSPTSPKLEDLHGMGEATEWDMELAADVSEWRTGKLNWSQVDRGVLLSGPPGTGKTQFAGALERSCEAHLVVGSIAKWQAQGHLGEMLRAMRSAFSEATENAPSILFIDEIDAVGDREDFEKSTRQRWRFVDTGGHWITAQVRTRLRLDSGEALHSAVARGLGIGLLPSFLVAQDVASGRLVHILPEITTETVEISVIYPDRRLLDPRVRQFIDLLASGLRF